MLLLLSSHYSSNIEASVMMHLPPGKLTSDSLGFRTKNLSCRGPCMQFWWSCNVLSVFVSYNGFVKSKLVTDWLYISFTYYIVVIRLWRRFALPYFACFCVCSMHSRRSVHQLCMCTWWVTIRRNILILDMRRWFCLSLLPVTIPAHVSKGLLFHACSFSMRTPALAVMHSASPTCTWYIKLANRGRAKRPQS